MCDHSPYLLQDKTTQVSGNTEVYPGAKGNTELYPSDIHEVLTQIDECKSIKLGGPVRAVQSMACVTGGKGGGGMKGTKRYLPQNEWKALSADAKSKIIESWKIKPFQMTTKKLSMMMSTFQTWYNDDANSAISTVDGTFDLCSNEDFTPKTVKGNNACKVHADKLQVCHPKQIGKFDHVQTVEGNMKLHGKQQTADTLQVRELLEKRVYPPTADYEKKSHDARSRLRMSKESQDERPRMTMLQVRMWSCNTLPKQP